MRTILLLAAGVLGGVTPALAAAPPVPAQAAATSRAPSPAEGPSRPPDETRKKDRVEESAEGRETTPAKPGPRAKAGARTYRESIEVTATLDPEARADVPASVTVVGREEIRERRATDLADLLRTVPGVDVARSGSPGKATSVFLRGASSNQTLVLWNGVRLNDPYFGGFDWSFLPTEGVDRVEVVRGPFSALYGSEAIGGVVQVLTGGTSGTRVALEGGSRSFRRGALEGGYQAGPVRLDVSGHVRRGDGTLANDFFDGEEGTAEARWSPFAGTVVGLVTRSSHAEVGLPFDFLGSPAPGRVQKRDSRQIAVPLSWASGPWSVDAQVGRSSVDLELRDPGNPFDEGDTRASRRNARLVVSRRFGERSWAAGGGDWERDAVTDETAFGTNLDDRTQENRAAFGELFLVRGRWSADLGARHDDNQAFGGETTLKAGGAVRPAPQVRLHASYGEGFRAPSLGDLYYPGFGNPDLRPETSASYELGGDWTPGRWRLGLTAFDTEQRDLIVFDFVRSLPLNVGRARTRGAEAVVAWSGPAVSGHLEATYQEPEDRTTGEQLLRRPRRSASAVVAWRPAADWTLAAVARFVGARPDFGADLPSYATLDLAASWRASAHLAPYVRLENALDRDYQEVAGFPAPGRTVAAGLELEVAP